MRAAGALSIFLALVAAQACATGTFHQVSFAGETARVTDVKPTGQTVYVVPNSQMQDTVLDARIRVKLEAFLLAHGYVISSAEKAEIYVLATFGSGKRLVATQASVFKPAEVTVIRDNQGNPVRRAFTPDRMQSLKVPTFENSVWLQVLSSDANYFRETGMVKNLWRGEAAMKAGTGTVADAVPYLLVPALKFFGQGTTSVVSVDVRPKDVDWREVP